MAGLHDYRRIGVAGHTDPPESRQCRLGLDRSGADLPGTSEPMVSSSLPDAVGSPSGVAQAAGRVVNIVKAALHFCPLNSPSVTSPLIATTLSPAFTETTLLNDIVLVRPLFQVTLRVPEYSPEVQDSRPVALKVDRPPVMAGSALDAHRLRVLVPCSTTSRCRTAARPGE
jgi:hypothetical protein